MHALPRHRLSFPLIGLIAACGALSSSPALAAGPPDPIAHADRLLAAFPLIDGHNDLAWRIREEMGGVLPDLDQDLSGAAQPTDTDIPRLRRGRVGAQFWSVYVPATLSGPQAAVAVMEQIDLVRRMVAGKPQAFALAGDAEAVRRIHRSGRIACLIGMEGGGAIAGSLGVLREFRRAGVAYMTLTHELTTEWADSSTDTPRHGGLSAFGKSVVVEMNRIGMMVDLSHVSDETAFDAIEASRAPVILSHSSARALVDHPRNASDAVLAAVARNDGVVMVNFSAQFVSQDVRNGFAEREALEARLQALYPADRDRRARESRAWREAHPMKRPTVADVADHIDHIRAVAGVEHVGLGGDFDGAPMTPSGLSDVGDYPNLFAELIRRGWSDEDLKKLAGGNILRVMRRTQEISEVMQSPNLAPARAASHQEAE